MSGPKGLSISEFNSRLNEIFRLQSEIHDLFEKLKSWKFQDASREIEFGSSDFVSKNEKKAEDFLEKIKYKHSGTVKDKNKIEGTIKELKSFLDSLKNEENLYKSKEQDYRSFISVENYRKQSQDSIEKYKKTTAEQFSSYISSGLNLSDAEINKIKDSVLKINEVKTLFQDQKFSSGYQEKEKSEKKNISDAVLVSEKKISDIRISLSDLLLSIDHPAGTSSGKEKKQMREPGPEIQTMIEKIHARIRDVNDKILEDRYNEELQKLASSDVFQDVYYYREFYEDLKLREKTRSYKNEIREIILEVNDAQLLPEFSDARNELAAEADQLLNKETLRNYEYESLLAKRDDLLKENRRIKEEQEIKKRRMLFLKSAIVESLQKKNYRVMDDMEVVDFEKENDFVLKVPDRTDYLNLRFNDDGTFLYNFLIDENKNNLSTDQIREKLSSMENTCTDFKSVLDELSEMGVKLRIDREIEVSEKALIQASDEILKKIKRRDVRKDFLQKEKPSLHLDR